MRLLVDHAVGQFGEFRRIPSVGSAYEIAGDALEFVDMAAAAGGTYFKVLLGVLISAVHAAVAVVVHRAVAYVVAVHQVDNVGDCLRVVGGIAVDFHIKYVAASGQFVVGTFDFGFMARRMSRGNCFTRAVFWKL